MPEPAALAGGVRDSDLMFNRPWQERKNYERMAQIDSFGNCFFGCVGLRVNKGRC
jgi:hypothetical protein